MKLRVNRVDPSDIRFQLTLHANVTQEIDGIWSGRAPRPRPQRLKTGLGAQWDGVFYIREMDAVKMER